MSVYETIQAILGFGMFTTTLIAPIVELLKDDKKEQLSTLTEYGYFL